MVLFPGSTLTLPTYWPTSISYLIIFSIYHMTKFLQCPTIYFCRMIRKKVGSEEVESWGSVASSPPLSWKCLVQYSWNFVQYLETLQCVFVLYQETVFFIFPFTFYSIFWNFFLIIWYTFFKEKRLYLESFWQYVI